MARDRIAMHERRPTPRVRLPEVAGIEAHAAAGEHDLELAARWIDHGDHAALAVGDTEPAVVAAELHSVSGTKRPAVHYKLDVAKPPARAHQCPRTSVEVGDV